MSRVAEIDQLVFEKNILITMVLHVLSPLRKGRDPAFEQALTSLTKKNCAKFV